MPRWHIAFSVLCAMLFSGMTVQAQYCTPVTANGCGFGDQITSFSTTGGSTNISNLNSGCSTGNYSFISSQTVTVTTGNSFNFTVQSGPTFSQGQKIWIDWNNDGDFVDTGEDVWTSSTWTTTAQSSSITVPGTIGAGVYRMRVRCSYNSLPTDPCNNQTYGEVEDYLVTVLAPSPNDAFISSFSAPTTVACSLGTTISVNLGSLGANTLTTATIGWSLNGVVQSTTPWTGSLTTGGSDNNIVLSTTASYRIGDVIKAWTSNPNAGTDGNPLNDTATFVVPPLSLVGNFTINSSFPTSGSNFNSFTDAVNLLSTIGVCGNVTFNVAPGTYNEKIVIPAINGSSASASVTFKGNASNNSLVTLQGTGNATLNYIVKLDGADHVRFEDMTLKNQSSFYSRVVEFATGSNYNGLENCSIEGFANITTTSNLAALIYANTTDVKGSQFKSCDLSGGSYSFYWFGTSAVDLEDTDIEDCSMEDFYYMGVYTNYQNGFKVFDCTLETGSAYTFTSYGIYLLNVNGEVVVRANRLNPNTGGFRAPIRGIYVSSVSGSNATPADISNNSVTQIDSTSGSVLYGIYFSNAGFLNIYHNSVYHRSTNASSRAGYFLSGGGNKVRNNVFVENGPGHVIYATSSFSFDSDYNNLYTTTGNVGYFSTNQLSLTDWQNASGFDQNSVSANPNFTGVLTGDLTTCSPDLSAGGVSLLGVVDTDYNGNARDPQTPDIGAYEFQSPEDFAFSSDTAVLCSGSTLLLNGATGGMLNSWSNGSTNSSILVGVPGSVSVTITDACGSFTDTLMVVSSTLSAAVSVSAPISCNGLSDGELTATASGGDAPYNYAWSNGATTDVMGSLGAGTFTVTITDGNGCSATAQSTLLAPSLLGSSIAQTSNLGCTGGATAALNVSGSGGTTPYTYAWSNSGSAAAITGLAAGVYTVTLSDANGCASQSSFAIAPSVPLVSSTTVNAAASCFGSADGVANAQAAGGASPYTYNWSTGNSTSSLNGVLAGNYTVTVTDAQGCTASSTVNITQPAALSVNLSTVTQVSCNGGNDGVAASLASGGTQAYSYSWSNGGSNGIVANLSAGTYSLTLTDANGCTATAATTVTEPTALSASLSSTNETCLGDGNGTANVLAAGGSGTYNYLWSSGAAGANVASLTPGYYTVTITDANGCTQVGNTTVGAGAALPTVNLGADDSFCDGDSYTLNGGGGVISYLWSTGATTSSITAATPGVYWVQVADNQGCTNRDSILLTNWPQFNLNTSSQNVGCELDADGSAVANVSGGAAPITYLWSDANASTTAALNNLESGAYTVTVTDANGCTEVQSATVSFNFPKPVVDLGPAQDFICETYTYTINPTGGFANYLWSNGETTSSIVVATPGIYSVVATDINGCSDVDSIDLVSDPCVGVNQLEEAHLVNFFPNPTNGKLNVQLNGFVGQDLNISIFDLQGRVVHNERLLNLPANYLHFLDLSDQAQGMYVVQLSAEGFSAVERISVK